MDETAHSDSVPSYDNGARRCPKCGSRSVTKIALPRDGFLMIAHVPRCCGDCGHEWTPQPSRWLAPLYFLCGLMFLPTGIGGLIVIPFAVVEWSKDELPIGVARIVVLIVMLVGSGIASVVGLGCLSMAKHLVTFPSTPRGQLDAD